MRYLTLLLFCLPAAVAVAADPQRPREDNAQEMMRAELKKLQAEVQLLKAQVARLQMLNGRNPAEQRGQAAADKDRLVAEAKAILAEFNSQKRDVWKQASGKIHKLRQQLVASLKPLQDGYTRDAKLEEAVAVRDLIRSVTEAGRNVLPDPGILSYHSATTCVLFFRVTGSNAGPIWGTDIYTSDCSLATAAVHSGVLKVGQTGIVKVTTIPSHPKYVGSTRHGITSLSYGPYAGFRVEAASDQDAAIMIDDIGDVTLPEEKTEQAWVGFPAGPMCGNDFFRADASVNKAAVQPEEVPAEATQQLGRFEAAEEEIRTDARQKVSVLAGRAIAKLQPIQDAHTRAARLDDGLNVRSVIRELTDLDPVVPEEEEQPEAPGPTNKPGENKPATDDGFGSPAPDPLASPGKQPPAPQTRK